MATIQLSLVLNFHSVDFYGRSDFYRHICHKSFLFLSLSVIFLPSLFRMIVCNQVMKFILDRIDKDERQAAKRKKKEEVVEAKRRMANASKLSALLYRHKESLKMEILKKRALLDKELQLEAQVSVDVPENSVDKKHFEFNRNRPDF